MGKDMWHAIIGLSIVAALVLFIIFVAVSLFGTPDFFGAPEANATTTSVADELHLFDAADGVLFTCASGKALKAIFTDERVVLTLSDERSVLLPQVISGSGARYANPDESFVFWNKGDTAFIQEDGVETYSSCVTAGS
ncbi:MAG: MliC family protein [Candidatus Kaiserbacteria bacterium]|nr:MAG: MliC family protein [Candidatus Kaiserbacteria bacterium]